MPKHPARSRAARLLNSVTARTFEFFQHSWIRIPLLNFYGLMVNVVPDALSINLAA